MHSEGISKTKLQNNDLFDSHIIFLKKDLKIFMFQLALFMIETKYNIAYILVKVRGFVRTSSLL